MTQITIHIGHFTDNIDKKLTGSAFGAVVEHKGNRKMTTHYSPEGSYMDVSLEGILVTLATLKTKIEAFGDKQMAKDIQLNIVESNVYKIVKKLSSVFESLRAFSDDVQPVLDCKLRRKDRSRYPTHAIQKEIVNTLLAIDRACVFTFEVRKTSGVNTSARTSFQIAETHLSQVHTASNVVPIAIKSL